MPITGVDVGSKMDCESVVSGMMKGPRKVDAADKGAPDDRVSGGVGGTIRSGIKPVEPTGCEVVGKSGEAVG